VVASIRSGQDFPVSKLLIVDDDEQLGVSMARVLGREGHECVYANDLPDATKKAEDVELVIIELQPGWLELLRDFRDALKSRARPGVPLLVTTGRRELLRKLGSQLADADDLLTKPFDAEELIARVQIALRQSSKGHPPTA
jgi:DNA-binding response OmpR family regulator